MARIASKAVAGYFPTPTHLLAPIARLAEITGSSRTWGNELGVMDPCAGEGEALAGIARGLFSPTLLRSGTVHLYAAEMERSRAKSLAARVATLVPSKAAHVLHADALRVLIDPEHSHRDNLLDGGIQLLFLNPPYDTDRACGRTEERFLAAFVPALATEGALLFVVPFYALAASARTLSVHFSRLWCFRFPESDFDAFKQVVLVGQRHAPVPRNPVLEAQVKAWATDPSSMPVLDDAQGPVVQVQARHSPHRIAWKPRPVDVAEVLRLTSPWHEVPAVVPPPTGDLLARRFPVAMPPRAAHIAAGIAAGVFNGAQLAPDVPGALPRVLVKGTFEKEFVTSDERRNRDGEVVGLVQVERPNLQVTVLDLSTLRYHTLRPDAEPSAVPPTSLGEASTGDFLALYGRGLLGALRAHCPVLHDPADPAHALSLAPVARTLYPAQAHATEAAVKLLRRDRAALVLGEIGAGKTTVALTAGRTLDARTMLVVCPPHLLDGWTDQVRAVLPEARVVELGEVSDIEALAARPGTHAEPVIALLSRETAKLGHALAGVSTGVCPRCGARIEGSPDTFAKRRLRCEQQRTRPTNFAAKLAEHLALALVPAFADEARVVGLLPGTGIPGEGGSSALSRWAERRAKALGALSDEARLARRQERLGHPALRAPLDFALAALSGLDDAEVGRCERAAIRIAYATSNVASTALRMLREVQGAKGWEKGHVRTMALGMVASLPESERAAVEAEALDLAPELAFDFRQGKGSGWVPAARTDAGSPTLVLEALEELSSAATFAWSAPCGEPLFQAVPTPRRFPLATYITRRHPDLFDLLVLDEAHEMANDGTAQERAAHRLTALGLPTLMLTGSVMNGYAESLFANLWALSRRFREEFRRDDRADFVARYGFRKRIVEDRDKDGAVVAFGSVTDRVTTTMRDTGQAPGVLPHLVLRHLLPVAVTLQKADLAGAAIPPCTEERVLVRPAPEHLGRHRAFAAKLLEAVKRDLFSPRAGLLWGQLSEMPSQLDRATADAGNAPDGAFEARYPQGAGGELAARAEAFAADFLGAKERWLIDRVRSELDEGRRVMVFAWHEKVLARLQGLLTARLGEPVPLLDAKKIAASKRQAWIDREVIGKGRRVLVVNPVAVQTGLNNLVWFATEVWMESPACNPIVYRQAVGRVDRIGQKLPTRILFPVYADSAQVALHKLLLSKVAVSMATDGLDAEGALAAAGAGGDTGLVGFSVGRQLFELLSREGSAP